MRSMVLVAGFAVALTALAWLVLKRQPAEDEPFAVVREFCVDCHNAGEVAGGLSFEGRRPDDIATDASIWEAALRKLNGRLMPPAGERRPSEAQYVALIERLETEIDAAAAARPYPGAPVLHRLNRTEYVNAIRDLLELELDATTLLPADDASGGFDNIADALSVSPAHMQAYVSAAAKISRLAVGDPTASPGMSTYRMPGGIEQAGHIDGMPLGTRGGMSIEHIFPLDADYEITIARASGGLFLPTVGNDEDLEVTLDDERIRLIPADAPTRFRMRISAGPHEIGAGLVARSAPRGVDDLYDNYAIVPGVQGIAVMGPFDATGPGETPSRRRVFVCTPAAPEEEAGCAREILSRLASRAFRRIVDSADPALETLMSFYEQGYALRGFEAGVQYALARILVDPRFIYRFEREPEGTPEGGVYPLDDFELATRLSFFLWSSIPDDELLRLAAAGELGNPEALGAQVRRMLADEKARALIDNFAGQWLLLRQVETVNPVDNAFDGTLRRSMRRETELLFESIIREDRSIVDLLDADYTFVDERLARHYGIEDVRGSWFRRVSLAGNTRRGILGHAGLLTVTSAPNRTSPVSRGAWVLTNVLGTPPPSPPPGVETDLDETAPVGAEPRTMRLRLERHRTDPSCAACHNLMDPIGFSLENFDPIGRWRELDAGAPIDATGVLWDGTRIDGPDGLREALLSKRDAFAALAVEKLMTYALGRSVEYFDMPAIRAITRSAGADDYRFSSLVLGIVTSVPFTMKAKLPPPQASVTE